MLISKITIDFSLKELFGLLEGDTIDAVKRLPEGGRKRLFDFCVAASYIAVLASPQRASSAPQAEQLTELSSVA